MNIPDINLEKKKPELNKNISITGEIPGLKKLDTNKKNSFNKSITLKEEFGKDIDDNIFNLILPKKILSLYQSNIIPEINKSGINLKNPQINIDIPKPNVNFDLPKADLNANIKLKAPSRNEKKLVGELISGEIPGIKINKSKTEVFTGEIPGKKIKKTETVDYKPQKKDLNVNLSGIIPGKKININKPKIETNISGPNIKIDKDLPDIDDFDDFERDDILNNLAEPPLTLKEIFSGNVDDNNFNLNLIKKDLWGNEEISRDEESNNLNSLEIDISNPEINTPSIDIPEIDANLKIKNPQFNQNINANINKPEIKEDINLKIPDINANINNKININKDIDVNIPKIQLNVNDKNKNGEVNYDKFIQNKTLKDIFSQDIDDDIIHPKILKNDIFPDFQNLELNNDEKERSLNSFDDFDYNIDIKAPEVDIPNIKLKGVKTDLNIRNKEILNDNNNKNDIDIPNINPINEEIDLNVDLSKKNKNTGIKRDSTLKELFGDDVDNENYLDLYVINPVLLPHNNTLYISGNKDKIKLYPTDDVSIKGPKNKHQLNQFNNNKKDLPKKLTSFSNNSSEMEIKHNIPYNFDKKIKLPGRENDSKDVDSNIALNINPNLNIDNKIESNLESLNCDENIKEDIVPINIDINYKMITNNNDKEINNLSKQKDNANNFHRKITLKELFNMGVDTPFNVTNTQIDYKKENKEDKINFPQEDNPKPVNNIISDLKDKNNINEDNKEEQKKKDENNNDSFDFDDLV